MDVNSVKSWIYEYRALGMHQNEILKALHQEGIHIELVKQALREVNSLIGAPTKPIDTREASFVLKPSKQIVTMDLDRVKSHILHYRKLGMQHTDILKALRADNVDARMIAQALNDLNAAPAPVAFQKSVDKNLNLDVVNEKIKSYTNNYQNAWVAENMGLVRNDAQHAEIALKLTGRFAHVEQYAY